MQSSLIPVDNQRRGDSILSYTSLNFCKKFRFLRIKVVYFENFFEVVPLRFTKSIRLIRERAQARVISMCPPFSRRRERSTERTTPRPAAFTMAVLTTPPELLNVVTNRITLLSNSSPSNSFLPLFFGVKTSGSSCISLSVSINFRFTVDFHD